MYAIIMPTSLRTIMAIPSFALVCGVIALLLPYSESKPYGICSYPKSVCGSSLIDADDRRVLLEFKSSTSKRDGVKFGADWNASLTCAKGWSGICADKNGRVTEISLPFEINGTIPKSIGDLRGLLRLDLPFTTFTSIPSTIGSISGLLNLTFSSFSVGKLPPSFANLTKLTYLDLKWSRFNQDILPILEKLTNLTYLDLRLNGFTLLPPGSLKTLIKLVHLDFHYNDGLQYNPIPSFSTLTSLEYLRLSECQLSGKIPSSYSLFKNLSTLHLYSNKLCGGIPSYLSNLPRLETLTLSNNLLTGAIPSNLAKKFCGAFDPNCFDRSTDCPIDNNKYPYECANQCNLVPNILDDIAITNYTNDVLSSTYWYGSGYHATDGSAGYGNFSSRTCAQTWNQTNPFLYMEFQGPKYIKSVQLYNRLDCCSERLNGVQVYVGNSRKAYNAPGNVACSDPKFKYGPTSKGFPLNVTCNRSGHFVWVVIPGKKKILTVCEVVILEK